MFKIVKISVFCLIVISCDARSSGRVVFSLIKAAIMVFTQSQVNDIKSIINDSIKCVLKNEDFLSGIAASVTKIVDRNLKETFQEINSKFVVYEERISVLENKNDELIKQNTVLSGQLDNLHQYSRRNNIRIFGLQKENEANTDNIVVQFLKEKLNLEVNTDAIDRSHWLGKGPHHILVRFVSYRVRKDVMDRKKLLKGSKYTVVEDLTQYRLDLLKKAGKQIGKRNVWTHDGRIWVQWQGRRLFITSELDLKRIVGEGADATE